jgi:hypothetical protein
MIALIGDASRRLAQKVAVARDATFALVAARAGTV